VIIVGFVIRMLLDLVNDVIINLQLLENIRRNTRKYLECV